MLMTSSNLLGSSTAGARRPCGANSQKKSYPPCHFQNRERSIVPWFRIIALAFHDRYNQVISLPQTMPTTVTKLRRRKVGRPTNRKRRPTNRKNGRAYTGAERSKRFRDRRKQERKQAEFLSTCEWYTPKRYIDAARKVLRSIDLDPATSSAIASVPVP